MRAFVITIEDNERSVQAANRCIRSAPFPVERFKAVTPKDNPKRMFKEYGLPVEAFEKDQRYSRKEPCMSAFLSHYQLWKRCISSNEEILILEHDAMFTGNWPPSLGNYHGLISVGKPSYGRYGEPIMIGVNPLCSKKHLPGAHAYVVNPRGAKEIVEKAKTEAAPTDVYLHLDRFVWLEEYYPWPVEAKDSFTTIQHEGGCTAKHNYGEAYDII